MRKVIAAVILALAVTGCDQLASVKHMFGYANAATSALEGELGVKPQVAFNAHNGKLTSVTVHFPGLYDKKPLAELAERVHTVIAREFRQKPPSVVLAFHLTGG